MLKIIRNGELAYAVNWRQAVPSPVGSFARRLLRSVTLTTLAEIQKASSRNFLRAIYCHYVFDDQREQFEEIITELKKIGTFVDTDTCLEMIAGKHEIDGRYLHLSFDDGFRNIFKNAAPILQRQQVPAAFFVPTSLMEANWQQTADYCQLVHMTGVTEMVNWEELQEMSRMGFEIGSHTRTHARFSAISQNPALLEAEILGSKHDLENRLGKECKYIAWPFGEQSDADKLSLQMTQQAGYRGCFSAVRGTINPQTTNLFQIPRHHFEAESPLTHIKGFARGMWEGRA